MMRAVSVFRSIRDRVRPNQTTMEKRRAKHALDFTIPDAQRWNHSIHYHPVLLGSIRPHAKRALDVGCGEGLLTREIRTLVPEVVGIDPDHVSIDRARTQAADRDGLHYIVGDVRTYQFEPRSFDVITAVNTIHQVDTREILGHMATLVRPGGVLGIIGVASRRLIADSPFDGIMFLAHVLRIKSANPWDHGAPMTVPKETFNEIRRIASEVLPGSRYRRRVFGRYTIIWHRPE